MASKFYDSPFHVTYDVETACKMATKMDLPSMIINLIKEKFWRPKYQNRTKNLISKDIQDGL